MNKNKTNYKQSGCPSGTAFGEGVQILISYETEYSNSFLK